MNLKYIALLLVVAILASAAVDAKHHHCHGKHCDKRPKYNSTELFCMGRQDGSYCHPSQPFHIVKCPGGSTVNCPKRAFCATPGRVNDCYNCEYAFDVKEFCQHRRPGFYCGPKGVGSFSMFKCPSGEEVKCGHNQKCHSSHRGGAFARCKAFKDCAPESSESSEVCTTSTTTTTSSESCTPTTTTSESCAPTTTTTEVCTTSTTTTELCSMTTISTTSTEVCSMTTTTTETCTPTTTTEACSMTSTTESCTLTTPTSESCTLTTPTSATTTTTTTTTSESMCGETGTGSSSDESSEEPSYSYTTLTEFITTTLTLTN